MASGMKSAIHYSRMCLRYSKITGETSRKVRLYSTGISMPKNNYLKAAVIVGGLGFGGGLYGYLVPDRNNRKVSHPLIEKAQFSTSIEIPNRKPSREVLGPATDIGLDLTLYQYQSCPFCCKVRAFLEYYGIPFKVIEVNSVTRKELKFSNYKKVPFLIVKDTTNETVHQLKDSSVIISILGTYFLDPKNALDKVLPYYNPVVHTNEDGKEVEEVLNLYYLMYGEKMNNVQMDKDIQKEIKWRKWVDMDLVHVLSPNIYRTYDEALQAFNHFSKVGEWEKNFSAFERWIVIYVGASAMYLIGKKLKKKYMLKDDVRQSLYDSCNTWKKGMGSNEFMGGSKPNLADLAVYGVLSSIEGCDAFKDLLANVKIGSWYYEVKELVKTHQGFSTEIQVNSKRAIQL